MNDPTHSAVPGEHTFVDAPSDLALDRLTRLAVQAFGVPVALVALFDRERHVAIRAAHGLARADLASARAFAAPIATRYQTTDHPNHHTTDDVIVVEDASTDSDLANQASVTGALGIRFYAAAPIVGSAGDRRGFIAVADGRSRRWDDEPRRTLAALAAVAADEIELIGAAKPPTVAAGAAAPAIDAETSGVDQRSVDVRVQLGFVTEQLPAILWTTDTDLRFSSAIGAGLRAMGLTSEQVVGLTLAEFFGKDPGTPRNIEAHEGALAGRSTSTDARFGSRVYQCRIDPLRDADGRITGAIGVALDITDRKRMEAKLIQAERLASLGTLAAGVAHEINNPLTYVMANIGYVSERLGKMSLDMTSRSVDLRAGVGGKAPDLKELTTALAEAQEGTVRVRQIVRDLRILARGDEERFAPIDVRRVIESSLTMVWNQIRQRAELIKDLGEVPPVEASESRMGQVILNLLINAVQAIPEGAPSGQQIRIGTRTDPAGRAVITVGDTGAGIPADVLGRVFDPFFTTKPVGAGTGLGLFICHGIVKALGGDISVESQVGYGATFRVTLPAARGHAAPVALAGEARPSAERRRRLLLVDDEVNVGRGLERSLAPEYDIVVVQSGRDALATLAADDRFDAILCDLIMPNLNGMELFAQIEQERPDLAKRIVFITGGAFTAGAQAFLDRVANPRLEKPFDASLLGGIVRALGDG